MVYFVLLDLNWTASPQSIQFWLIIIFRVLILFLRNYFIGTVRYYWQICKSKAEISINTMTGGCQLLVIKNITFANNIHVDVTRLSLWRLALPSLERGMLDLDSRT